MATSGLFAKSGTASSNTPVGGVALADSMTPLNLDNAMRAIIADEYTAIIARGTDIASASTLDLDGATTPSLTHNITGTTTTTAITLTANHWRILRAVAAWPLTASSTLIINGSSSVNYTCTAEDRLLVEGFGSSVVRVTVLPSITTGTWTPSLGGNATYTVNSGTYTKIGRMVYARFTLTVNTIGTGSLTTISGLPFTNAAAVAVSGTVASFGSIANARTWVGCYVNASAATISFSSTASVVTSVTAPDANIITSGASFTGSVTYEV